MQQRYGLTCAQDDAHDDGRVQFTLTMLVEMSGRDCLLLSESHYRCIVDRFPNRFRLGCYLGSMFSVFSVENMIFVGQA